jgi:hypothetical protein
MRLLGVRHRPVNCQHCDGSSGHPPIPDEGVLVCYPCILRLGRKVAEAAQIDDAAIARRLAALGMSYPEEAA